MAIPKKYADLDFTPNDGMIADAQRGLDWRSEFSRGGTEVGIARARDIVNRRTLSPETVRRMYSFFSRHEVDKEAEGFRQGEDGYPSNGRIAWALWGGDSGFSWSRKLVNRMNNIDEKTTTKAYSIGVPTDLQTGTLSDVGLTSWERGQVIPKIFEWARDEDGDIVPSRARRAFLIVNGDSLDTQDGYSFPIAVPNSSGTLIVTEAGVNAAGSRLGALINNPENTDIPLEVLQRARTRLNVYRDMYQEKGVSITDMPVSQDDIEWGEKRIEEMKESGEYWKLVNNAGITSVVEKEESDAESNHQSKFSLVKSIVLDWLDSVFKTSKQTIEVKLDIDDLDEISIATNQADDIPTDSAVKILKNKAGRYVFIGRYSNNFRDNDGVPEIITKDAHRDYAKRVTEGLAPLPELWLYHDDSTRIGKATHVRFDEIDGKGFAMVFGLFDKDKEYIADALMQSDKSLAMSHGYGRNPVIRDRYDKTLITKYTSHEVSIVAPEHAANKLTTFNIGVKKMIENKESIADALGIEVSHLDTLEAGNGKAAVLAGEVIESKTVSMPETKTESEVKAESQEAQLAEVLSVLVDEIKGLKNQLATVTQKVESQDAILEKIATPMDAQIAQAASEIAPVSLKAVMARAQGLGGLSLSAVGREETKVDGRQLYGKDEPKLAEQSVSKLRYGNDSRIGLGEDFD